jgi:outer membrane protein assembly factor BamB
LAAYLEASAGALAQDWPQWRGPNRDGAARGITLPNKWPKALKQLWEVRIGEGCSSPVLAGGRIYTHSRQGEDEVVSCLDVADGRAIWSGRYAAPWRIQPGAGDDKGPHSTPTVHEGRLFTLGINGVLTCWDARRGDVKWRWAPRDPKKAIPQYGASLSPLIVDGLVLAHGAGEGTTALAAFDARTGEMKWAWHGDSPAYASPILAELAGQRQIILLGDSKLAGLSPSDGKPRWTKNRRPRNSYENIFTPIVYKDMVIYSQTGYPEIMAVRVTGQRGAIRLKDVWANRDHRLSECTPMVVGDLLIGLSHARVGHLFCLDPTTGRTLWQHGSGLQSIVPLVSADGHVLAITKGIRLTVLRPSPRRYEPLAEWQGPTNAIRAGPVFLGDRILMWDSGALRMMSLRE